MPFTGPSILHAFSRLITSILPDDEMSYTRFLAISCNLHVSKGDRDTKLVYPATGEEQDRGVSRQDTGTMAV